ncbi:helix-turn-helix transcriptional regulator [Bacillus sp. 1P10SD]|uniref:helix-turn-helix domain-containing protein n=1 Tax=Bacillus sp. 1P10SD TaxID=3132265 RepID=UPI0039A61359
MDKLQIHVGKRIKELRNKNDISQLRLSLLSNLDRTYINSVENGRRNISIGTLKKITDSLEVTLEEFFSSNLFNEFDNNKETKENE